MRLLTSQTPLTRSSVPCRAHRQACRSTGFRLHRFEVARKQPPIIKQAVAIRSIAVWLSGKVARSAGWRLLGNRTG
jgi:hypothetical protein